MARVNVDDDWFSDVTKRRAALVRAVQSLPQNFEYQADGMALDAWRLAQRYWKNDQGLIPEDIWRRAGLEPLIACDLAIRWPDGVYVRGTKEKHDWLQKKVEAAQIGGKARAKGPRDDSGRFSTQTPATVQPDAGKTPAIKPAIVQARTSSPAPAPAPAPAPLSPNGDREPSGPRAENPVTVLLAIWNANRGSLPEVLKLNDSRKRKAKARWAEEPRIEYWEACVRKMAASSFCIESKWADFDWLIANDNNHVKASSGKYDSVKAPAAKTVRMLTAGDL